MKIILPKGLGKEDTVPHPKGTTKLPDRDPNLGPLVWESTISSSHPFQSQLYLKSELPADFYSPFVWWPECSDNFQSDLYGIFSATGMGTRDPWVHLLSSDSTRCFFFFGGGGGQCDFFFKLGGGGNEHHIVNVIEKTEVNYFRANVT